ncbi:MAG: HAD-IIB family hydrolase [Deltaproteobacteria bacterium]|nr:HAD-IIB family hydrolase [Deltaproteobacteria bacterium]
MRPLASLAAEEARRLRGLVFDLDGTILTGGALSLEAYGALFALRASGLRLVACTGRPAGWGAVVARQWPVDLAVAENGAVCFRRVGQRLEVHDRLAPAEREERTAALARISEAIQRAFPEVPLADDHAQRRSDVTFDVRETVATPSERVADLRRLAASLGARTIESSIHVHLTLDLDDKASGTVRALGQVFGDDPTEALATYAFVGDSANDEPCFSSFRATFGVANVKGWSVSLSVPPRFVAAHAEGAGFAEIAARLVALRDGAA